MARVSLASLFLLTESLNILQYTSILSNFFRVLGTNVSSLRSHSSSFLGHFVLLSNFTQYIHRICASQALITDFVKNSVLCVQIHTPHTHCVDVCVCLRIALDISKALRISALIQ